MLTLEAMNVVQDGFALRADLSIRTGEVVAVLGPSGGGKSTLLNAIAGFVQPISGRISWQGADLADLAPGERPITMVFQDNNLFAHLSAFDNVAIGLRPSQRLSDAENARVLDALDRVGLSGLETRKPAALSGGQQGRVTLARALLRDRPLLLLDEPFAALGPALRRDMLELVAELARSTRATVLMVTHDPHDAAQIAAQTVFVDQGEVHRPVPTAQLLAAPPQALKDYLGQ